MFFNFFLRSRCGLFTKVFLSACLSIYFCSTLIATDSLIDPEKKGFRGSKRLRDHDQLQETAPATKIQKIKETPDLHSDMIMQIFLPLKFSTIAAGQLVSKTWNQVLCSEKFCNLWGVHLVPSTAQAFNKTSTSFIRYFSTPSLTLLNTTGFNNVSIKAMSADGSTLIAQATDISDHCYKAAKHTSEGWVVLPSLNNGQHTTVSSINENGSVIVGSAEDGANNNIETAVRWTDNTISTLPSLDSASSTKARAVNRDGSVIVGEVEYDNNDKVSAAVRWLIKHDQAEINELPCFKKERSYSAHFVSYDGTTIVGTEMSDAQDSRPNLVQWTDKINELPCLNRNHTPFCNAINHDASLIVGVEMDMGHYASTTPVQLTKQEATALPLLTPSNKHGWVNVTSADGLTLCGVVSDAEGSRKTAVVWKDMKINDLQSLLEKSSPRIKELIQGGHITNVNAISANGLQVAGMISLNGNSVPFKAILPSRYS